MNDMSATTTVKSDQINAADLLGGPITVTIDKVNIDLSAEQPVSMRLVGMEKVYRPCRIMRRVMVENWGADANTYVGHAMTLFCDPKVRFGKDQPGGTRISHMSHITGEKISTLMVSKGKFAPHLIRPLETLTPKPAAPAAMTAEQAIALSEGAANRGTAFFREWFNSPQGKDCRSATALNMATLKQFCTAADNAALAVADPFGLPPLADDDPHPTEAELAAAEQAAMDARSEPDPDA